jgi:hypothetical protein
MGKERREMMSKKKTIGSDKLARTIKNFTNRNIKIGERLVRSVPLPKKR